MLVNKNKIFYKLFDIKGNDKLLFPEGIDNFIVSEQHSLLKVIRSDEKMIERYKKAFNRKEVIGLCSFLCAHAARHNLLVNENAFSEKFFDCCTLTKENGKKFEKSQKSLIEDLMNEAEVDNQYFEGIRSQNSQATSKKLNEMKKKLKELKKIANSKKNPKKSKQITQLLEQHEKICKHPQNSFSVECQLSQKTMSISKNFMQSIDENLKLSAENKDGYSFLCFVPRNTLLYGNPIHVLLIKKNGDNNFAFYDPNIGVVFGLTKEQLCKIVTQVFSRYTTNSKFYKHDLNDFASARLANTFVLSFAAVTCLVFFTAIAVIVTSTFTTPIMILLMSLSAALLAIPPFIHCLSKNSESKLKILYQKYTTLYEASKELIKERPIYNSIELIGIPNISEISQLSKDVENLEEELTYPQEILQETHSSKLTHDLIRPTT